MPKRFPTKPIIRIIVSIAAFAVIAKLMMNGSLDGFDLAVQKFFFGLRNDFATKIIGPFSYTGNWPTPTAICAILLIVPKTRFTYGIPMSTAALSSVGISQILKYSFCRPRPDVAFHLIFQDGWSFPSGHAITSLCTWIMLIWLLCYYHKTNGESLPLYRKSPKNCEVYPHTVGKLALWICILVLYIICMGLSRLYVGVHWGTDVLSSWVLGIAILSVLKGVFFYDPRRA